MITVSVFFLEIGVGEDLNQLLPVMENMMESLLSKVKGHDAAQPGWGGGHLFVTPRYRAKIMIEVFSK